MIDWIVNGLAYVLNCIYVGLGELGVSNIGLTIIVFALIMRLILFPLTYKSQKNSKMMQCIQPELRKIMKKYQGKRDNDSMMQMQMEQQAVYQKYGTSSTSGCLPMLIQMPILFAIVKIVYNIPNYIPSVREVYMNIAQPMVNAGEKVVAKMSTLAVELQATQYFKDYGSTSDVISLLFRFKESSWDKAAEIFASHPDVVQNINLYADKIREMNEFAFGINLTEAPKSHGFFSVYILIPVAAALFQLLQTMTIKQPEMQDNMGMGKSMKMMMLMTPLMSLIIYYQLSSAIGLYWAATALFTVIQQVFLNWHFNRIDMDALIEKQMEKAKKKKKKKSFYTRMMEASMGAADASGTTPNMPNSNGAYVNQNKTIGNIAKMSTKNIIVSDSAKSSMNMAGEGTKGSSGKNSQSIEGGSISAIANMLREQ